LIKDQWIRNSIVNTTGTSVVVEASAGTGKTTLLTDRVCKMVLDGVPLESLVIVTFTEAAAGELRLRIREKLPPERRRKMDQAWISTIHGFASRLLREYYHLAGGAPEFAVENRHFTRSEIRALWDIYLSSAEEGALRASAGALRSPGSSVLLAAAEELESHRWFTGMAQLGNAGTAMKELSGGIAGKLKRIGELCSSPEDLLCRRIQESVSLLEEKGQFTLNLRGGATGNWGGKDRLKEVRDRLGAIRKEEACWLEPLREMTAIEPALEQLVIPFVQSLRAKWDEDPTRLSFNDLLNRAYAAVDGSPELRDELEKRFFHFFIDEFQDTSVTQTRLFTRILGPSGIRTRLTVVGDPKQSIFGWRNADIETYKETVENLEEEGALSKAIEVNFRSNHCVIDFVNSIGPGLFGNVPPKELPFSSTYSPLAPSPRAEKGSGVFVHRLPPGIGGKHKAWLEARLIASLVDDSRSTAVLLRSKVRLDDILAELDENGRPYWVYSGRDFHERPEIIHTATLLRALLNPSDKASLVHSLRSFYFGISDIEITSWLMTGCQSPAIREALELTGRLREAALCSTPELFIRTIYRNTCVLPAIEYSGYQVHRRLSNMRHLLEAAEACSDCTSLLELIEGTSPESSDEPRAPAEEGSGAVTVTTIHSAKGLAWDHVIIADPGGRCSNRQSMVFQDPRSLAMGIKLGDSCSAHYPRLLEREGHRSLSETRRLLYVAVTRPRDRLDIILPSEPSQGSPAAVLSDALKGAVHYIEVPVEPVDMPPGRFTATFPPGAAQAAPFTPPAVCAASSDGNREMAMRFGTEVHSILEYIDLRSPREWVSANRELLGAILEFPGAMDTALGLFDFYSLEGAELVGREYPIIAGGKKYYVDLLVERNGILEAVDYKTDREDPEERALVYGEKQRLYRLHLEAALKKPVRTLLAFIHHRRLIETG
jgi:ATP-dependent helicase/nuclease subunit A